MAETADQQEYEEFPERDEEMMRRGEEAKKADEQKLSADFAILKAAGEDLNHAFHDISDADIRNGFPKASHKLDVLCEQFLNILWAGYQLSAKQAFSKNPATLFAQLHTTLNAPEPIRRFNMIERKLLAARLDTTANQNEVEKVNKLNPEDYQEEGYAAMALCRYVKAIYNYMYTTKALAKKGITEEQMNRQKLLQKGNSKLWNSQNLSKVKKCIEHARTERKNVVVWDHTGSSTTYFKTFEMVHETKERMQDVWEGKETSEQMLAHMRGMVVQAMKNGKILAFNMCRSVANFDGEFKSANFPAETIFDYDKCRRHFKTWMTETELKALAGEEEKAEPIVHPDFMIVFIFKSQTEDDLISGLAGIPGIEYMHTTVVKKSLI